MKSPYRCTSFRSFFLQIDKILKLNYSQTVHAVTCIKRSLFCSVLEN